jgi:hypothetical protein
LGFIGAPTAQAATCGITAGDIAQITAIENDASLTSSQEITQELAARKKLVGETIMCAQQEAKTFQINLASTTVQGDSQQLQGQLLSDLGNASNFYNLELTKLSGVGISGSEEIAQAVLAWRAGTFLPLSENVNNFILWAQNQSLFDTAQTRMTQTGQAVSFLEGTTPNVALQTAFDNAQSSFNSAESENLQAKAALAQGLSPDQSLALIKQSLASLSATYQNLFTVSTLITNNLPQ